MSRTARSALGSSIMLLKGEHLPCSSMCLADVVAESIETGAAVCRICGVCEGIVVRYAEILLWDTGECQRAFSPAPDFGFTVVELC